LLCIGGVGFMGLMTEEFSYIRFEVQRWLSYGVWHRAVW